MEEQNPPPMTPQNRVQFGSILLGVAAVLALVFSTVALLVDDGSTVAATGDDAGGASGTPVTLTEFTISPDPVVASDGLLVVSNDGGMFHNLQVTEAGLGTGDLLGGESEELDVSSLAPGDYEIFCNIAGHAEAGMIGTLRIPAEGEAVPDGGTAAGGDDGGEQDWAALDAAMTESILEFPAETEGLGNEPLQPEVLADGTKRFELTASIVPWEVEPGKIVDAWAYNGMVPGPWIKVAVGDKVQVHVTNDLPMGTDIHWHGVKTPNPMDGVAPLTQELIAAGSEFTYEFTAETPAVGMYHAHHHGQRQVPNGLLGVFQIGDVELPRGRTISGRAIPEDLVIAQEIPMVLNDAGVIGLSLNGKSFPATAPYAVNAGDWTLVHYLNEGLLAHPMHQHQFPQLVVAKDGIPLDNPYFADTVNVAPGERYSVLVNPTDPGVWVWHCHILNHVESDAGMFGMVTALIVS